MMTSGLRCKKASIVTGICTRLLPAHRVTDDDTCALLVQTSNRWPQPSDFQSQRRCRLLHQSRLSPPGPPIQLSCQSFRQQSRPHQAWIVRRASRTGWSLQSCRSRTDCRARAGSGGHVLLECRFEAGASYRHIGPRIFLSGHFIRQMAPGFLWTGPGGPPRSAMLPVRPSTRTGQSLQWQP